MTVTPSAPVVLDTNVVVSLARNNATGQAIEAEHGLSARADRPLISTVAEGEILGLARSWNWGEPKLRVLREVLAELVPVEAGLPEIVETYAALYAEATRKGKPRGENDLWIAATAMVFGAELITCDKHFLWLHPEHLTVCFIPEAR